MIKVLDIFKNYKNINFIFTSKINYLNNINKISKFCF